MISDWNGKKFLRMGECNHCGECCAQGWRKPCPHLKTLPDYKHECAIYQTRANADDPLALEQCGILSTACAKFPSAPGDLFPPAIRNKCGYYFVEMPKILVACPVHECKEYGFKKWIEAVKKLTYPAYEVFVVDNSPTMDLVNRYKDQVPIAHIDVDQKIPLNRITKSMEVIRQHFLKSDCERWFNLECDVIPAPDMIEVLLTKGQDADWIGHAYPLRGDPKELEASSGIGCVLLTRRLIENYNFDEADQESPDCWLWDRVRAAKKFKTVELWGYTPVKHLGQ